MASASLAVSAASKGLSVSSVSSPVARMRSVQSAGTGSAPRLSSRAVPATRSCAPGARPRQNVRKARVSWSHHCMLSRTSSIGRSTASSARARPSKKRRRCQASTRALEPAPRSLRPPEGTSLSTSVRQASSSAARAAWTSRLRSQSATGASASRPAVPKHWLPATTAPCRLASRATSATRRVFPTPAPPRTTTRPGWPATAPRHSSSSTLNSLNRPTIRAAAIPDRAIPGPVCGSGAPAGSGPERAIRRSNACRVAGSGVMASSRSRTEAQWW